jgi:hypothetical protein
MSALKIEGSRLIGCGDIALGRKLSTPLSVLDARSECSKESTHFGWTRLKYGIVIVKSLSEVED